MHAVDGAGGHIHGRVEAEGEVGAGQIVVDGLRNAHHFHSVGEKLLRHRERVIAANRDQGVATMFLEVLDAVLQAAFMLGRIGARGAQDGAAARQDATHRREVEFHGLVFQHPAPALHESHELVFVVKSALAHHRPNHRVQPGAIASAGQHSNLHRLLLMYDFLAPV